MEASRNIKDSMKQIDGVINSVWHYDIDTLDIHVRPDVSLFKVQIQVMGYIADHQLNNVEKVNFMVIA